MLLLPRKNQKAHPPPKIGNCLTTNFRTRAYRMKIEDWGLRKYKSSRVEKRSQRLSRISSTTTKQTERFEDSSSGGDIKIPDLKLIPESQMQSLESQVKTPGRISFNLIEAFDMLLTKWQTGVEYRASFLQHPDYPVWQKLSTSNHGPILFRLIEKLVPPEEQFNMAKSFLEDDLIAQNQTNYPYLKWRDAWTELLDSTDWEDAKEPLYKEGVISEVAGDSFRDYALVVIAERQLRDCQDRLKHWRKLNRPLNPESEVECAASCRRKYLDILKDFRHTNTDVGASFYKYSLEIIEWDQLESGQHAQSRSHDVADEYRHKYLKLINHYQINGNAANQNVSSSGNLNTATLNTTKVMANTFEWPPAGSWLPENPPNTREAFNILMSKWKSLSGFNEYAHSIITKDGWAVFIFEAPFAGSENLFSVISQSVPQNEQISLVKALLVAFSSVSLNEHFSPWSISWWCSVYTSPSWETFLIRLDEERIGGPSEADHDQRGGEIVLGQYDFACW